MISMAVSLLFFSDPTTTINKVPRSPPPLSRRAEAADMKHRTVVDVVLPM